MNNFDVAFNYLLKNECNGDEVSNNPNDHGGVTKYGISLRFLKSLSTERLRGYGIFVGDSGADSDDIVNLDLDKAKAIYKAEFWSQANFDKINTQSVCSYIFDMAVNMGIAPAIKCAQRACWSVMLSRGTLQDDGIIGSMTLDQINQAGTYLLYPMRSERAAYYRMIVEHNPAQREFLEGWLNRSYR